MNNQWKLLILLVCVSLLAGCGSGGQGNPISSQTTNPGTSSSASNNSSGSSLNGTSNLAVSPSQARVLIGNVQQFVTSDSSITWEVNGVPGGDDTFGTISSTGTYAAPAVVPLDPVVTINAKSAAANTWYEIRVDVGALTGTQFAYVSSASDNSIQGFVADAKTGTLQPVSTIMASPGTAPTALAVSPNGKYLYSLNRGSNDISIFAIDPTTGDLSSVGRVSTPNGPYAMVFSASGHFAYVSCDGASTIEAYALNLSTGALIPVSGAAYMVGGGRIQSLAISPDGKYLYAANRDTNQIVGLTVDQGDGSLTPVGGSPFWAQAGLSSIAFDVGATSSHDYQYLYAGSNNGVEAYTLDSRSGTLNYQGVSTRTSAGKSPELFRNVSDGLLIGVNPQSGGAFSYAFDYLASPSGGAGPGGPSVSTGISPVAGAWLWNGSTSWVYVLNRQGDASSTTGSIGVYKADYTYGLVGPSVTIQTALHDPIGFVITP